MMDFLFGRKKSANSAKERLQLVLIHDRTDLSPAQLESLKVDKKSIVFGSPSLSNAQSARRQQIEAMVTAQMRARGKKAPKGLQTPQTVTVSASRLPPPGWIIAEIPASINFCGPSGTGKNASPAATAPLSFSPCPFSRAN